MKYDYLMGPWSDIPVWWWWDTLPMLELQMPLVHQATLCHSDNAIVGLWGFLSDSPILLRIPILVNLCQMWAFRFLLINFVSLVILTLSTSQIPWLSMLDFLSIFPSCHFLQLLIWLYHMVTHWQQWHNLPHLPFLSTLRQVCQPSGWCPDSSYL